MCAARNTQKVMAAKPKPELEPKDEQKRPTTANLKGGSHPLNTKGNGMGQKLDALVSERSKIDFLRNMFRQRIDTNCVLITHEDEQVFIHNKTMYDLARYYAGLKMVVQYCNANASDIKVPDADQMNPYIQNAIAYLTRCADTFWEAIEAGTLSTEVGGPINLGKYPGKNSDEPADQLQHVTAYLNTFVDSRTTMRLLYGRPKDPTRMNAKDKLLNCEHLSLFPKGFVSKADIEKIKGTFPASEDKELPSFKYNTFKVKISAKDIEDSLFNIAKPVSQICVKIKEIIDKKFETQSGSLASNRQVATILKCLGAEGSSNNNEIEGVGKLLLEFSPKWLVRLESIGAVEKEFPDGRKVDIYFHASPAPRAIGIDEHHRWFNQTPVYMAAAYGNNPLLKKTLLLPGSANAKLLDSIKANNIIPDKELVTLAIQETPVKKRQVAQTSNAMAAAIAIAIKSAKADPDDKIGIFDFLDGGSDDEESQQFLDKLAEKRQKAREKAKQDAVDKAADLAKIQTAQPKKVESKLPIFGDRIHELFLLSGISTEAEEALKEYVQTVGTKTLNKQQTWDLIIATATGPVGKILQQKLKEAPDPGKPAATKQAEDFAKMATDLIDYVKNEVPPKWEGKLFQPWFKVILEQSDVKFQLDPKGSSRPDTDEFKSGQ